MIKSVFVWTAVFCFVSASGAFANCIQDCMVQAECPKAEAGKNVVCEDPLWKCEEECRPQTEEDDALFRGTKFTDGNTVIMQGERIAAPLSAFQGGHLRPEDLEPFRKTVVSSTNAKGTVSVSTSSSQHGWITGSHERTNQTTEITPGVSVSTRKTNE